MEKSSLDKLELDKEWMDLILEARNLGVSIEEVKEFLNEANRTFLLNE